MIAYKFLRARRTGPFSGFSWPEPGVWVHADGEVDTCMRGIHACRASDLPWWLAEELWEVELAGEIRADEHKVVAETGRLTARVEGWTPARAHEFAEACAWRARDRAVEALVGAGHDRIGNQLGRCATLDELQTTARTLAQAVPDTRISLTIAADGAVRALAGTAPTSAYIAAHAALRLEGIPGYAAERAWQARWLVERLGLA